MSNPDSIGTIAPTTHITPSEYKQPEQQGQLTANPVKPVAKAEQSDVNAEPDREELDTYVKALNDMGESKPPHMRFDVDESTGRTVVRMTHNDTGELVRQIPSEEFLRIARMVKDNDESLSSRPGQWIQLDV